MARRTCRCLLQVGHERSGRWARHDDHPSPVPGVRRRAARRSTTSPSGCARRRRAERVPLPVPGVRRRRCTATASQRIVDLLVSAGVPQEIWRWPAELAERRAGPPLTPDDLLDLHVLLEDDGWFDAARGLGPSHDARVGSLHDGRLGGRGGPGCRSGRGRRMPSRRHADDVEPTVRSSPSSVTRSRRQVAGVQTDTRTTRRHLDRQPVGRPTSADRRRDEHRSRRSQAGTGGVRLSSGQPGGKEPRCPRSARPRSS